jgi:hypothetical protein
MRLHPRASGCPCDHHSNFKVKLLYPLAFLNIIIALHVRYASFGRYGMVLCVLFQALFNPIYSHPIYAQKKANSP